jgi:Tfp pilus assembly protein PilF
MDENTDIINKLEEDYAKKPYHMATILQLIEAYENKENWQKVTKLLRRLSELDEDKKQKAKFLYTAAGVYHFQMDALDDAVDYYEKTLENDPLFYAAFHNIVKIRRTTKKWRKLERNYRSMIKRVSLHAKDDTDRLYNLWFDLGELYNINIKEYSKALVAYETAIAFNPSDLKTRLRMADVYKKTEGGNSSKAKAVYESILEIDPYNNENMTQLFTLHWENQDYDKAWCLSALIKGLDLENEEAERFYTQHAPRELTKIPSGAIDTLWDSLIISTREDYYIGQLFSVLADVVPFIRHYTLKSHNLHKEIAQTPQGEGPTFNKIYYYILKAYGFSAPDLFLLPEEKEGLIHKTIISDNKIKKIVTAGGNLLSGHLEKDLAFMLTRDLLYLLPGYYLIKLLPSRSELVTVVLGAIKLANPRIDMGSNERVVNKTANQLHPLIPEDLVAHLSSLVKEISPDGQIPDIDGFINRTRLSSHRAAFLLSQDIVTALKLIKEEDTPEGSYSYEQKKKALIKFAASKTYFKLREKLNLTIGK